MPQAPESLATSALIQFVPRQVMLDSKSLFAIDIKIKEVESKIKEKEMERVREKKKKSKSSNQSETLENGSIDPKTLTVDNAGAKGKSRQMLLSSIAAFLESNGFHKTLAVFRSETQLEDDGLKASSIDFEGLFYKFMESSRNPEEAAINCKKAKDSQKTDTSSKGEIEHVQKKRRKHRKEPDDGTNPSVEEHSSNKNSNGPNNLGNSNDLDKLKSAEDLHVGIKNKKKKKKSLSESLEENADKDDLEISAGVAKESDKNDKSKKKKKHKMSSDGCVENENNGSEDNTEKFQEIVEEKIAELKSLTNLSSSLPAESNVKHKGEKKKKTEATSGSLDVKGNKSTEEALKESDSVKEKTAKSENGDGIEKKAYKKRKRLDSEGATQDDDATMAKVSKHIKLEGAENNKECGTPYKPDKSLPDNEQTTVSKNRKTEKSSEKSDKAGRTSLQEQDPSCQFVQKESGENQLGNGELEKSGKEGGTASKSQKKEKRSAEPKTVNAFQRVKIDEVKFADERLQDNSYWALDDMGSGYGAKAQEVLGQVRGRDFRHEKTKKKRGTYRGGQIDLQSHSIKFNYSDEE